MRFTKHLVAAMAIASVAACGGGGGDDEEAAPEYLAGTYEAKLTKTHDNCLAAGPYGGHDHVIRTEGAQVTAQVNTINMTGSATSEGGLHTVYETKSDSVITRVSLTYTVPSGGSAGDGTFAATLRLEGIDIKSNFTCRIDYAGTVVKK